MHLEGEFDAAFAVRVENRVPFLGEVAKTLDNRGLSRRRVTDHIGPERRAGEASDDADADSLSSTGGRHHLFRGPLLHAKRVAVSPDVIRQESLVTAVDRVADR